MTTATIDQDEAAKLDALQRELSCSRRLRLRSVLVAIFFFPIVLLVFFIERRPAVSLLMFLIFVVYGTNALQPVASHSALRILKTLRPSRDSRTVSVLFDAMQYYSLAPAAKEQLMRLLLEGDGYDAHDQQPP
ncbi:MAG: hypothetical protein IT209_00370 [Armatimonadetes bacterium]|nr:hypothetical protein [Armatimonadota bacterium]